MADQSSRDRELSEAMEACRPGYDDLADPGLADLAAELANRPELEDRFSRLQKLDATLAASIQDVPVPEGLRARLLLGLAVAHGVGLAVEQRTSEATALTAGAGRQRAMAWGFAAMGTAAALALVTFGILHGGKTGEYTAPMIMEEAIAFYSSDQAVGGQPVADVAPARGFPLSTAVRQWPGMRWRNVGGFLDHQAVAYDIESPHGVRATLYVVRWSVGGLPSAPASRPAHGTGNCVASVWQSGGLLYVLVVQGDSNAYLEFLDAPHGQITCRIEARPFRS